MKERQSSFATMRLPLHLQSAANAQQSVWLI